MNDIDGDQRRRKASGMFDEITYGAFQHNAIKSNRGLSKGIALTKQ